MATNVFFSNNDYSNTSQLIEDLVIESIQIFGVDTWYVTRTLSSIDNILNEDKLSIFDGAYNMEMYVKTVDGFQGEGDFLSKFGLQIRDQATFTVAIRTFEKYATRHRPKLIRPKEGDMVYMPLNKKLFKITFVEHESVFYQTGALQVFDLKCELFEYSNERFETGFATIDNMYASRNTINVNDLEELHNVDPIAKNVFYEDESSDLIDFSEIDPFSEIIEYPITRTPMSNTPITTDSTVVSADTTTITADVSE